MASTSYAYNYGDAFSAYGNAYGYSSGSGTVYHQNRGYDAEGLKSLCMVLCEYDMRRKVLETKGGSAEYMKKITALLCMETQISGPFGKQVISLNKPDALRSALTGVGQSDVKLNIRRLNYGLPVYYLARTHNDWWGLYSLIVEDIHMSPDYPLLDRRFARIMKRGKEHYYLRLSLFRQQVIEMLKDNGENTDFKVNSLLYDLGRSIFQGSWHTDQRFAFAFADTFGILKLRNTIELVYLSLSCDLSALRRSLTPSMHTFFETCYTNPNISRLLNQLESMTGKEMSEISQRGLVAYQQLTAEMNRVLATEFEWRTSWLGPVPLWKIVVANVSRLDIVAKQLGADPVMKKTIMQLEESAEKCANLILENKYVGENKQHAGV